MKNETRAPGWWRRNALALGLAAVLLVATVGITSWKEWSDYFGTRPVQPISVDVAAETQFAGATWQLVNVLAGTSEDVAQIPDGTTMLLVRVQVTPDPGGEGQQPMGPVGYAWTDAAAGRMPLHRCRIGAGSDHFVSPDPSCEGQIHERLLGYGLPGE